MPTADWDTLEPTAGTPANAYELGLDVYIGAAWVNVPDITALNPATQPKTRNRSSYAAKGKARPNTIARDVNLGFNVEQVRDDTGQFQDELQYLLDKAAMLNEDNQVRLRYFDTLGAGYAFEGVFSLETGRANTGDEDPGWSSFTASSVGGVTAIDNPVNDDIDPALTSAGPQGVAATGKVLVKGLALTGATAAHVGATAATSITVFDDRHAEIVVPAGSAGLTYITVTTPDGTSAQLPYTRGA